MVGFWLAKTSLKRRGFLFCIPSKMSEDGVFNPGNRYTNKDKVFGIKLILFFFPIFSVLFVYLMNDDKFLVADDLSSGEKIIHKTETFF
jgi:hypothetical protein